LENKLRDIFPHLNLLSLDMDAGASEVNLLNRLHFMVTAAREQVAREKGTLVGPETVQRNVSMFLRQFFKII
jgi:predicted nucleotide-binding protein (sugar kinase/HSP70/actin superfamily)